MFWNAVMNWAYMIIENVTPFIFMSSVKIVALIPTFSHVSGSMIAIYSFLLIIFGIILERHKYFVENLY